MLVLTRRSGESIIIDFTADLGLGPMTVSVL